MSFRRYLLCMACAAAACWAAVAAIIVWMNPLVAGLSGIVLFYASMFLAVVGTLALLGILLRMQFFPHEPRATQVAVAFRQAMLFGVLIDGALFLARQQLLTWWTLALFIALLTGIEALFVSVFTQRSVCAEESEDA